MIILALVIGGLTYLAGTLGTQRQTVRQIPAPEITPMLPQPGEPVPRYFQVDPAIVAYLDSGQPSYGVIPVDTLGLALQPIGAYLPRTGDTRFDLTQATVEPTPLPYPTAPPLPLPPAEVLPTIPALAEGSLPRTLPYEAGDRECAPTGWPAEGILTQRFHLFHSGIDIGVPLGTPVLSTHSGQVIYADFHDNGLGYLVVLQSGPFITYYAHNTSFNVSLGQTVGRGSVIAWSGSTGNSTGPHIHYEIRINNVPVDPLTFESRGYPGC
jgi:murein DD-endopeptidase MepM/ murein hydrolase activator NlpD